MVVNLDLSGFEQLLYLPTGTVLWRLFFWYFGWMPVAFVMLWGIIQIWLRHRRLLWGRKQKHILLAIDVPRNNAQSPRAVENMFIYFAGAHGTLSLIEKWWEGKYQLNFSFEIVSIGGFIQFLIHTPASFRNLVETAVYSQYPDAEIYEVEDYTIGIPNRYPDDEYDIWGAEFIQHSNSVLPIRTYPEFEHKMGESEVQWKDPMASLMDLMSSLQKGEQLWYQIILVPIGEEWKKERDKFVSKILKEKLPASAANNFIDGILKWMGDVSESIYSIWGDIEEKKKDSDPLKMMNLKPSQKVQIEAADMKANKLGFDISIRGLYVSRKEVMNKAKAVNGFVGYIKQFNTNDLNSLKPDMKVTATSAAYFFAKQRVIDRKNKIMYAYKQRSDFLGRKPWVMNVEELATLWHFPIDAVVKAPLIQRAGARRVEPPMSLPFGSDLKKTSVLREPIFDQDFEIEEDKPEPVEEEEIKTAPKSFRAPAFMDEEDSTIDSENEEIAASEEVKENQAPFPINDQVAVAPPLSATEPHQPIREPSSAPAELQRGKPPANLPFVD